MSNRTFIGALLLAAAVIAASVLVTRPPSPGAEVKSPARAHDFALPKLEGGTVSLASLRGRVVVLGETGRNFAAGMSGGIAYVLDWTGDFATRTNKEMVGLEPLQDTQEIEDLKALVQRHADYTNSELAWRVLIRWDELLPKFVKVMPKDYKRVLEAVARVEAQGLSGDEAVMAAFESNKSAAARVGGN